MDMEERLRRLELENLAMRERIWEMTSRLAMLENLVKAHILNGQNTNPEKMEMYSRLSNLENYVQNLHSDGTDCGINKQVSSSKASYKTTDTPFFNLLQSQASTTGGFDYGYGENLRIQPNRGPAPNPWGTFNPTGKVLDSMQSLGRVVAPESKSYQNSIPPPHGLSASNGIFGFPESSIQYAGTPSSNMSQSSKSTVPMCTKLCGKITGHTCGQSHGDTPCPPCKFSMKGLRLKCGHRTDLECHLKDNIADFKCHQCDDNMSMTSFSKAPIVPGMTELASGDIFSTTTSQSVPTVAMTATFSATESQLNSKPQGDNAEENSWMAIPWDDDGSTATSSVSLHQFPPLSSSLSQPKVPSQSVAAKKPPLMQNHVMMTQQQQTLSSSSTRTNSPALSSSGLLSTEKIFSDYMRVNSKQKPTRRTWIENVFRDYTEVQLTAFLRSFSRFAVKLVRAQAAAAGQLLQVMCESTLTTQDAVMDGFLTGIISDLPKIQLESKDSFELIGYNVCYILVAIFNDEKDLTWLVKLGKNLGKKPALWAIISTEILHLLMDRKKEHGLLGLWQKTGAEKIPLLQSALAGTKLRVK